MFQQWRSSGGRRDNCHPINAKPGGLATAGRLNLISVEPILSDWLRLIPSHQLAHLILGMKLQLFKPMLFYLLFRSEVRLGLQLTQQPRVGVMLA